MTLTMGDAPLASTGPDTVNYTIDGPRHRLLAAPFPRRVRAEFGGALVFDTRRGQLLHESNLLPVLYVPVDDIDTSLLEPTDHSTHCPFKGDAAYWSVRVGDRLAENAAWGYDAPIAGVEWLRGRRAFHWDRLDAWYDEAEEVFGHLRDPYHRVDVRQSDARVTVRIGGTVVAESGAPMLLSENGLPSRWYLPPSDVRIDLLRRSDTTTVCPYKGTSTYWSFTGADGHVDDVAWSYDEPLDDACRVAGHFAFDADADADAVTIDVG